MYVFVSVSCTQSCPILCDPMDCILPGPSVYGIFQARLLEWVAISSSRVASQCRDWVRVSCLLHWQPHFFLPLSHTEKPCLIIRVSGKETTVSSFVCDYVAAEMPGQVRSGNTLGLTSYAAVIWSPGAQHSLQVAGVLVTLQGLHGEASLVAGIGCGVCTPATLAAS